MVGDFYPIAGPVRAPDITEYAQSVFRLSFFYCLYCFTVNKRALPVLCLILVCFPVCSVFFAKVTLVVVGYFAFFPCVVSWLFLYDCQYQCKCDLLETVVSKITCNTLIGIGDAKLNSHSLIQQMTQWAY